MCTQGDAIESVQVYKNGGVGALGQMGAMDAAVRAERWAWVAIIRKEGELRTYVNGRLCSEIKLDSQKSIEKAKMAQSAMGLGSAARGDDAPSSRDAKGKGNGKEGAPPQERFCIDPMHLALFATREPSSGTPHPRAPPPPCAAHGIGGRGCIGRLVSALASTLMVPSIGRCSCAGEHALTDDGGERGLALRYFKLVSSAWTEDQVCAC